jgi:hypothetical protein
MGASPELRGLHFAIVTTVRYGAGQPKRDRRVDALAGNATKTSPKLLFSQTKNAFRGLFNR